MAEESEIKTKIVEEPMTAAKNDVFIVFFFGGGGGGGGRLTFGWRRNIYLVGGESTGGIFLSWGEMSKFLASGEGLPLVAKRLYTAFEFQL